MADDGCLGTLCTVGYTGWCAGLCVDCFCGFVSYLLWFGFRWFDVLYLLFEILCGVFEFCDCDDWYELLFLVCSEFIVFGHDLCVCYGVCCFAHGLPCVGLFGWFAALLLLLVFLLGGSVALRFGL